MDVKTTFLNGDIDETIYMVQPENFVSGNSKSMVCKLKKFIYSLKRASRQWYHKFHQVITSYGFEANIVDDCVYYKFSGSKYVFLILYVDTTVAKGDKFSLKQYPKNDLGRTIMLDKPYGSSIGNLKYAQVCTHPNTIFIVGF